MKPEFITIHCSATPNNRDIGRDEIEEMHNRRGWRGIGYHYVIRRDGTLENGRSLKLTGAHVYGHNKNNIGIVLIGTDEFTEEQFETLRETVSDLCGLYGVKNENVLGHRDWSPDKNGDGKITSDEWVKRCPCFDVREWWANA